MSEYRFHLQKYRPGSKTTCPNCGKSRCFVRYIDEQGNISFPGNVGKCDHENSCDYTPKEYFKDNPDVLEMDEGSGKSLLSAPYKTADKTPSCIVPSYIPSSYVLRSLSHYSINPLHQYFCHVFGENEASRLFEMYRIGTSSKWGGATVFWQTDINGLVRTGKVMCYNAETGHRVKEPHAFVSWAHSELKLQDFHLKQCLFGEHGTAEANENERHWNDDKIDRKNQDPTNHYDKTRMKLNFEIGPDGKVHPLGYQEKSLEVRLQERLTELGWKPFKPDSKIQPNCCAKFIFGGNHDRTLEMAFGTQTVNLDKGADNSHLQRCPEIEQWAKDVYDWCAKRYGQKNIIGFQVHLDESSPHIHALIVPVGQRAKSGRECVMWSAKFGKSRYGYGHILRGMHTSLYEEVGSKYGLERGDSIEGRNVSHLSKRDYIRKLSKDAKQAEKAVKGLQTMIRRLEAQIFRSQSQLEEIEKSLASGKIALQEYEIQKIRIQKQISEYQSKLEDKACKLQEKEQELEKMTKNIDRVGRVAQPFRNHKIDFEPPRITGKPPIFGVDKWIEEQNRSIASRFVKIVRQIEELYRKEAEQQQIQAVQNNALLDYREFKWMQQENARLTDLNNNQTEQMQTFLDQLAEPSVRERIFSIADALIGGQPVAFSSGGGGGNADSDLRWDGRRPDEE